MDIVEYENRFEAAWTAYVESTPAATIAHQIEWREAIHHGLGHRPRYLLAIDGSAVKGVLPMFVVRTWWGTRYLVSLPWIDYGGICADDQATARALLERAEEITNEEKAESLEMRSVNNDDLGLCLREDKVTFLLELHRDSDALWKGFDAKLRNQIRKADKSGLTTELGGEELLAPFYLIFAHNMRDLGTPVWGRKFFETILKTLGEKARIVLVRHDDKPIACGLVLYFKDRIYVPSASAYRSARKLCPNHALYWYLIKRGCEEGYDYFDFGRSSRDSATYNFKKQWCPASTQLTWQYYLNLANEVPQVNPDNPKYRLFIKIWQKLPLAVANYLGPKVIKNFP